MRIIYLDIDSMRTDHFGCYGYHRPTTPNMDRIAQAGVRFTHAYCNSSPCVPARASFISGRFGIHHGALTHWGPGSHFRIPNIGSRYREDMPLLTRYLRQHGYETISFSSFADRHQALWFSGGWSELHTHTLKGGGESAEEVNAAVLPWLRAHGQHDNYFLHIQYWDPHRNYHVDQHWVGLIAGSPPPAWPDQAAITRHRESYAPFTPRALFPFGDGKSPVPAMPDQIAGLADWKQFVDGYDASIRYMDHHIGQLLETLDELGVLAETAFIISADHGEAMGEQGIYGDHVCAGEAVHHIPLIVRWPGVTPEDMSYDGLLYNVDLHPTLCDLLGISVPSGWDGQSFAPALRGDAWAGRPYLVWDHGLYSCQRAVRTPDWLFIRTYHPGVYPFDRVMLYDMARDPHQTDNRALAATDKVAQMDSLLQEWLHETVGHPGSLPDPMPDIIRTGPWKYVTLDGWLARLRREGYDAEAHAILARLSSDAAPITAGERPS